MAATFPSPLMARWARDEAGPPAGYGAGRDLPIDRFMLLLVTALVLFGLVMVYSSSAFLAEKKYGSQFYFLERQVLWAAIGLGAMAAAIKIDYRRYNRPDFVFGLLGLSFAALCLVFLFSSIHGTQRWIRLGPFSVQPSEMAKIAVICYLAYFVERRAGFLKRFTRGVFPVALVTALAMGLIAKEPDLGTALLIGVIFAAVMFTSGARIIHLALIALPPVPVLVYMLVFVPWRLQRLLDFMDPWKHATTSGFQITQSLIGIGTGGATGLGLAEGKQKLFFLPFAHTDFIFSVIGEELGLVGALIVVAAFALLAWRGFRAARHAPDPFGRVLAVGLTTMIAAQALFNISVALSLVPTKGIPLPFISCGGSSLAINLIAAGMLLNISKHGESTS